MKIYFLSSRPCVLTVNDAYFGVTDLFERFAEISLKDNLFLRFTPENAHPLGFFLTEDVRFHPPEGVEVYLLPNAIALYARDFAPIPTPLKLVAQKRRGELLATVFSQGTPQLSLQAAENAVLSELPTSFLECEIVFLDNAVLLRSPTQLAVYNLAGKRLLMETVSEYFTENGELNATLPLSDSLGREATCRWRLEEEEAVRTGYTLRQARTKNGETDIEAIAAELLPYAFFESVLYGADPTPLLGEELIPAAEKIKDYLGNFSSVTLTESPNVCGLVYPKAERLFEVRYCTVETENGKITDVKI